MKILIINPPFYRLQGESLIHYPPGCCNVAATLEAAGHQPLIYNADYDPRKKTILGNTNHINIEALFKQNERYIERLHDDQDPVWQEIRNYLRNYNPDLLIVSVFNTTMTAGNRIAGMAKAMNPRIKTAFEGFANRGLHCAIDPSRYGDFSVMDFALRKEPDETVVELVQAIQEAKTDFRAIKGLSWKNGQGETVHNAEREFIEDLDRLPFPARHRLDRYEEIPPHCFQGIYGSRGCPFPCVFCGCQTSMGYKPRMRSAKHMLSEIEYVHKRFRTRYFYICDDIFFMNKERAQEFCRGLLDKKLPVYWSAQTRAEMADDETMALARKAGCQHVAVGVEVGNPRVREIINKKNTVDDVRQCARVLHRNNLRMVAFCIVGFPWEGKQEIEDTVNLVREIKPYIVYPYMPTPAAGTELVNMLEQKNPGALTRFRDQCHIDSAVLISQRMSPEEKKAVVTKAMQEFIRINKRNLLADILARPGFYLALANDMDFFRRPGLLREYLTDYFGK